MNDLPEEALRRPPATRRASTPRVLLALLIGLACTSAQARIISDDEASSLSLEDLLKVDVFSTTRYVRELSSAPSAASVITAADIRAQGYRNLADILKSLPGLYITYDRNYSYLGSRGYGKVGDWNSRILFLVDGHRINENIYDGAYIGNDFILDISLIDRLEYVAGPAAAMLYGNNAFFGVVNIVTKTGQQIDGGEAALGFASAQGRDARATFGKRYDTGLDLLFSVSGLDNDGRNLYMPEFGGTAHHLDYEHAGRAFAKIGYGEFTLELAHNSRRKGVPNASYNQVFDDSRSRTDDAQTFADLNYNHPLGDDSAVSGRLYYGGYDYQGRYVNDLATAPPPDIAVWQDNAHGRWYGLDLKYVSTSINGHKLLIGADYQRDLRRDQDGYYLGQARTFDDRRSDQRWGLYVHDAYSLNQQLILDIGARYDRPTVGSAEVNPRLGVTYRWPPDTTLKAFYGSAFRPPNVFELYYATDDDYRPNPKLAPERIRSRELVLDQALGSNRHFIATYFHHDIRDLIDYAAKPGADGLVGTDDDYFRFENAGRAHTTGLELRYEHPLPDNGLLRASLTSQRTQDGNGQAPENSPYQLAKLAWHQRLFGTPLMGGLEIQHVGARHSYANTQVKGTTLANLTISSGRLLKDVALSASVFNLFDQHFTDPAAYFNAPLDRIPQDGREWRVQMILFF
jgi:iron complex outermembrane receptor protein